MRSGHTTRVVRSRPVGGGVWHLRHVVGAPSSGVRPRRLRRPLIHDRNARRRRTTRITTRQRLRPRRPRRPLIHDRNARRRRPTRITTRQRLRPRRPRRPPIHGEPERSGRRRTTRITTRQRLRPRRPRRPPITTGTLADAARPESRLGNGSVHDEPGARSSDDRSARRRRNGRRVRASRRCRRRHDRGNRSGMSVGPGVVGAGSTDRTGGGVRRRCALGRDRRHRTPVRRNRR